MTAIISGIPGSHDRTTRVESTALETAPDRDPAIKSVSPGERPHTDLLAQLPATLPLSPIEKLFLIDSSRRLAKTIYIGVEFEGRLDREALEVAVRTALERHPLLNARIIYSWGRPRWQFRPVGELPLEFRDLPWQSRDETTEASSNVDTPADPHHHVGTADGYPRAGSVPITSAATPPADGLRGWFDLTREPGARFTVFSTTSPTGNPYDTLWLQFHHACTDGNGIRRFFADLICIYHNTVQPHAPVPLDPIDPQRLLGRGTLINRPASEFHPAATARQRLVDAIKFVLQNPQPIARPRREGSRGKHRSALVGSQRPALLWDSLSAEQTQRLEQAATTAGYTVHDLALATLFKVLVDWNREHSQLKTRRPFRIIVPTDLRESRDLRAPAMNRLSLAFISRLPDQCTKMSDLLPDIADLIEYVRRSRISLDLLQNYHAVQRLPGLFPLLMGLSGCMASAVLSNVGDPSARRGRGLPRTGPWLKPGGVVLRRLIGAAPLRRKMNAGFTLVTYGGRLTVSLQVAPDCMTAADGRVMLNRYMQELNRWVEAANAPAVS